MLKNIRRCHEILADKYKVFRKWYFKNSNITIPISGILGIMFIVGIVSVFNTFSKTGFNQNVVVGEEIINDPYFTKLTSNDEITISYGNTWDGSTASGFAGGNGSQNNPYIINTGAELNYFRNWVSSIYNASGDIYVKLGNNIDLNNITFTPIMQNFGNASIYFDGDYHYIKNLTTSQQNSDGKELYGLFGKLQNYSQVYNLMLEQENINVPTGSYGNLTVGGVAALVAGHAKVYNCGIVSGKVEVLAGGVGNGSVGTLVGQVEGQGVVTNSYSNANVISNLVNGGIAFGGVVGRRWAPGNQNDMDKNTVVIYLLAYYGNISVASGNNYQFVYNGHQVYSKNANTFCYYLWHGDARDSTNSISSGNDNGNFSYAIAKSFDEMTNDGFKAHLNNYRYMVNYYLNFDNTIAPSQSEQQGYPRIASWYTSTVDTVGGLILPKLKVYQPISNDKYTKYREISSGATCNSNEVKAKFTNSSNTNNVKYYCIQKQGKDEANFDYVNNKIVLPFNSVSTGFTFYNNPNGELDRVITGWTLERVKTNSETYSTAPNPKSFNFDFTLRNTDKGIAKDIGTVYAQGGYYLVPDGVTEVEFTTKWAYAVYVGDSTKDMLINNDLSLNKNGSNSKYGSISRSGDQGKSPNNPVDNMASAMQFVTSSNHSGLHMYDVAFVLVNNFHLEPKDGEGYNAYNPFGDGVDDENDSNKFVWFTLGHWTINEVTFMSIDKNNDLAPDYSLYYGGPINTHVVGTRFDFVNVLENPQSGLLNSGLNTWKIDKHNTSAFKDEANFELTETVTTDKINIEAGKATSLRINGGYVSIDSQWNASTVDPKMNYIFFGGNAIADYVNFGQESTASASGSQRVPIFNITGGRIRTLSSSYKNADISVSNRVYINVDGGYIGDLYSTYNSALLKDGNIKVTGSYINNLYAGGHSDKANIAGGVITTVSDSTIDYLYGGPQYGSISNWSTLNVINSNINYLFGGGYGGTQEIETEQVTSDYNGNFSYNISSQFIPGSYSTNYGILTNYNALIYSQGAKRKQSFSKVYSKLSSATVDRVFINLKDSHVYEQLYGGGNKGVISKSITMNIQNSIIGTSSKSAEVYGGGKSNQNEYTYVCESNYGIANPTFKALSIDNESKCPSTNWKEYRWSSDISTRMDKTNKLLRADNLVDLGKVNGNIYVNVDNSTIYGNIYGGGNLSEVNNGNIHLNLYNDTIVTGNIYGGGNQAEVVNGSTDVRLNGGDYGSAFAGGDNAAVNGSATLTITDGAHVEYAYGGGNNTSATETQLYIHEGIVDNAFGGSNNNGTITNANVYAGKLNTASQTFTPTIPANEHITIDDDEPLGSSSGASHPNLSTGGYIVKKDIVFNYTNPELMQWGNNSPYHFDFTINRSQLVNNTINSLEIKFGNANDFGNQWFGNSGYSQSESDEEASDGNTYHFITWRLNNYYVSGSEYRITFERVYRRILSSEMWIESVKITSGGKVTEIYASQPADNTPLGHITDDRFNFEYPTLTNSIGPISIGNLYGGNNNGGKTVNSRISLYSDDITVNNIYGGGNIAETDNAIITLDRGTVGNVYGGGNMGEMTTNSEVILSNMNITGNVFGGGKGSTATVNGDSSVVVKGTTEIGGSVFGGGDAANTGNQASGDSKSNVSIKGGHIHGNVYGGANTAVIYGEGKVLIGTNSSSTSGRTPITIDGTVFGGGESSSAGNQKYDYSFNSVTSGIYIDVIGSDTYPVTIKGSIFGSGNAANSGGFSHVNIYHLGTKENPNFMASIQRADDVNIFDSYIALAGATDSPNEFDYYLYSMSRINSLTIANNTSIYLEHDFNLVKEFNSMLYSDPFDDGRVGVKETVSFEDGVVTTNVDNRLYSCAKKSNSVNIRNTESEVYAEYQDVNGMAYFGLYISDADGNINEGIYSSDITNGETVPENVATLFKSGSYVRGRHKTNHDKGVDGFYSNFADPDTFTIETKLVPVTSEEFQYYEWPIGEQTTDYDIDLIASKYATTGTGVIEFSNYNAANTHFQIIDFGGAALANGVTLVDSSTVPRIANSEEEALSKFGLKMSSNSDSWITNGTTEFFYDGTSSTMTGETLYYSDNSTNIPTLEFYLAHSRNINTQENLGTAVICLVAYVPLDEVTYTLTRININVNIRSVIEDAEGYDGAMTSGRKTEIFVNGNTTIDSDSQLSTYYSMFMDGNAFADGGYRYLESTYKLPVNTRITMIDRSVEEYPVYYYYVVTEDNYNVPFADNLYTKTNSPTTFYQYRLSDFIKMGSLNQNNKYSDEDANISNYYSNIDASAEEYIFTFDFSEAAITENVGLAEIFLTYQKNDVHHKQLSTFRGTSNNTLYNIITSGNASLLLELPTEDDVAYVGQEYNLDANIKYQEAIINGRRVADTKYSQDKLGMRITLYNSDNNKLSGTSLLGTIFYVNSLPYSANLDGSVRLKVADNVANVDTNILIDLSKSNIATDNYKMVIEVFGSPDGLFFGETEPFVTEKNIRIVNEKYGLKSTIEDARAVITGATGLNDINNNNMRFNIEYSSRFSDPNIRVKLYRRNYDEKYSLKYTLVDLQDYVETSLVEKNENEYLVTNTPEENNIFELLTKENITTGTYKVVFEIYNGDNYIDEVFNYIFIR